MRAPTVLGSKVRTSDIVAAHQRAYEVYAGGDKEIEAIEDPRASIRPGDSLVPRSVIDVTG